MDMLRVVLIIATFVSGACTVLFALGTVRRVYRGLAVSSRANAAGLVTCSVITGCLAIYELVSTVQQALH
ncbi:MAG TPA: hypothetical protein VF120_02630 [Ktedonobacterales bacterium]